MQMVETIKKDICVTFLRYISTSEGRSDFGFHPPKSDPVSVLPVRKSP